ncbi:MAG: nitrogen fixation protein FixH [Burkholderiales bacterium]|jgi:hypothetical protein|nr:nitrogen fixation protein FixH [Burkholderiales bacterium]
MKRSAPAPVPTPAPWWREKMMWIVVGGPAAVVVASVVTAAIAWNGADRVVVERVSDPTSADAPALAGRNHAATPPGSRRP